MRGWRRHARGSLHFAELPQPRTAVLLGGSSRHVRFDRMAFEALAAKLDAVLARDGGSVLAHGLATHAAANCAKRCAIAMPKRRR